MFTQANEYHEGWGGFIFQSGNEMAQNFVIRNRMEEMQAEITSEKEWWEKRRASIQTEFMKELDMESSSSTANGKVTKTSDDEAVLVEVDGPTATGSQQGGGTAKNRKKKGKN
jgi:translocation protein SEC66